MLDRWLSTRALTSRFVLMTNKPVSFARHALAKLVRNKARELFGPDNKLARMSTDEIISIIKDRAPIIREEKRKEAAKTKEGESHD
jgi:hypothetical protein